MIDPVDEFIKVVVSGFLKRGESEEAQACSQTILIQFLNDQVLQVQEWLLQ
jgi:hypothetical protein